MIALAALAFPWPRYEIPCKVLLAEHPHPSLVIARQLFVFCRRNLMNCLRTGLILAALPDLFCCSRHRVDFGVSGNTKPSCLA